MQHMLFTCAIALCGIPLCAPLLAGISPMWRFFTSSTPPLVLATVGVADPPKQLLPIGDLLAQNTKPPKRHANWLRRMLILLLCGLLIPVTMFIATRDNAAAQPTSAYLYTSAGQVVYLEVEGALNNTTGTWLEADRTAHGVVRHEWTMQYQANDRTVHIVLHTPSLDLVVTGTIDNAQYSVLSLTLPPNAVGLFPPTAHFHAATPGDWNSAYTSLVASVGVTP